MMNDDTGSELGENRCHHQQMSCVNVTALSVSLLMTPNEALSQNN